MGAGTRGRIIGKNGAHIWFPYSNKHIYFDSENGYIFRTNQGGNLYERFKILNNGNVGIGTTNPTQKLHIAGGRIASENTEPGLILKEIDGNANENWWISTVTGKLQFKTVNDDLVSGWSDKVTIQQNGNVGIGTTSPSQKLDVNGNIALWGSNFLYGSSNDHYADIRVIQNRSTTRTDGMYINYNSTDSSNNSVKFYTAGITERMRINNNGNVGIGTTSPGTKLHVAGITQSMTDSTHGIQLWPVNTSLARVNVYTGMNLGLGSGGVDRIYINGTSGNVGIGTTSPSQKLHVVGNILATDFLYSSDKRLKKDIKTLKGLDLVKNLRGVSFKWKDSDKSSIGFIAQEVEKVLPELVATAENTGLKSVKYGNISALLVEAVKSQQEQIELLKQEIKNIKK